MTSKTLDQAELRQFTGSERYYRHALVRAVIFTDGAKYVADAGGAYWLLDEIAFGQSVPAVRAEPFQHWKLTVDRNRQRGVLTCDDGNGRIVFTKTIPYTDFPLGEIRFYFTNNTILLPSEN